MPFDALRRFWTDLEQLAIRLDRPRNVAQLKVVDICGPSKSAGPHRLRSGRFDPIHRIQSEAEFTQRPLWILAIGSLMSPVKILISRFMTAPESQGQQQQTAAGQLNKRVASGLQVAAYRQGTGAICTQ